MSNLVINSYNIFHSTSSGVQIYDLDGAYIDLVSWLDASSVWADDSYVYIGTTDSGVLRTSTASISGAIYDDLQVYKEYPNITNNEVIYLHGGGEYLCVTTVSGVDQYNTVSGTRIYTIISGADKCFQTVDGAFYYNESDELHSDMLLGMSTINDIYVTEGTSMYNNDNVLFIAANNGAHIIEERKGDEINSRTKRYYLRQIA
jgi:hypothetical protein